MFKNNREWEKTEDFGMLPPRCYYTPFDKTDAYDKDREKSSRFQSLNGEWNFKAHERIEDCELNETMQGKIDVPSCVQMKGYDRLQYTNIRYPFPFDPPYIDKDIPVFHYRRTVDIAANGKKPRLVFEGVDSAFYVFLNGELLGYSQITHRLTEFDLSAAKKGANTLDVIVLKWNASSYLEDQDKWRFSGIFGCVYVLYRDENAVEDYFVKTKKSGDGSWTLSFENVSGGTCFVSFENEKKEAAPGKTVFFTIGNPRLWSAEIPDLYPLTIESGDETIYEEAGFRETKIENGVFYFNGKPIKLCGVNRHEFHPEKGAAISIRDAENDIILMKKYHVNAIRTSHYPNMPEFYRLCDRYGIYVFDEADVEAHGASVTDGTWASSDFKALANSDLYESAIVSRAVTMVRRDKNRPSVIVWSLGNESNYGKDFVKSAKAVKAIDDTRFVHYEQHYFADTKDEYYDDTIDLVSRMYPAPAWMKDEYLKDKRETRPMVYCEYCHAMGNGPGDLEDYWKVFRSSDRLMGGFIWEWADHGILKDGKFFYGGDFKEKFHDGNFCIDGIVSPERKEKAGTLCMKHVYQPVEFSYKNGKLSVKNRYFFKALKGTLKAEIKADGKRVSYLRRLVDIPAGEKKKFTFAAPDLTQEYADKFVGLRVSFTDGEGFTSGDFIPLRQSKKADLPAPATAEFYENDFAYILKRGDVSLTVDRKTGDLLSVKAGEKEYLAEPMKISVRRAPADNERGLRAELEAKGVYDANERVRFNGEYKNGTLTLQGKMLPEYRRSVLDYTLFYALTEEGFAVRLTYRFGDGIRRLPATGFRFAVKKSDKKIGYFGFGPQETYRDTLAAAAKDVYSYKTKDGYHHYIKPQESGNHAQTERVKLPEMQIFAQEPFDFSAIPYSVDELTEKTHDFALRSTQKTYVFLGATEGVGSNSCGPVLAEEYRVPAHGEFAFTFRLF